jgi:large subunit ribosomal protein L31
LLFLAFRIHYQTLEPIFKGLSPLFKSLKENGESKEKRSCKMKPGIHPKYAPTKITCICGNVIETSSTKESFSVEVCSACHPFFTGKIKLLDMAGRVEKFQKKTATAVTAQAEEKAREEARAVAAAAKKAKRKAVPPPAEKTV